MSSEVFARRELNAFVKLKPDAPNALNKPDIGCGREDRALGDGPQDQRVLLEDADHCWKKRA
jgi:hypothetical protein